MKVQRSTLIWKDAGGGPGEIREPESLPSSQVRGGDTLLVSADLKKSGESAQTDEVSPSGRQNDSSPEL